jgi:hypothetical protein
VPNPGYIAGEGGEVVKYDPKIHAVKRPQVLTRHQRATIYFKALRYAETLFKEVGFYPVADPGHGAFVLELGNFMLEMVVQEAPQIAYVTSYPGYQYDPKKINAKVTMMVPAERGEYVIRAIATLPNLQTCDPVFIVVDKDSPNVLRDAFMNIVRSAHSLIRRDPATLRRIQQAMASRNLEKDFERFSSEDDQRQLLG